MVFNLDSGAQSLGIPSRSTINKTQIIDGVIYCVQAQSDIQVRNINFMYKQYSRPRNISNLTDSNTINV